MIEYFSTYAESATGQEGVFYCEVKDGIIQRHVTVFDGRYYWATPNDCFDEQYDFTERSEFGAPDETTVSLSGDDFRKIWEFAIAQ